jgi:ketosteroid isomerase-like protein
MTGRRETTLRGYEAVNERDLAALKELMHPDVELESRFSVLRGTTYHGHGGVADWLDDLADAWEYIEVDLEDMIEESDDRTLVLVTLRAKGRESGVEVDEPVAQRHHWRGERIFKIESVDRREAERLMREGR